MVTETNTPHLRVSETFGGWEGYSSGPTVGLLWAFWSTISPLVAYLSHQLQTSTTPAQTQGSVIMRPLGRRLAARLTAGLVSPGSPHAPLRVFLKWSAGGAEGLQGDARGAHSEQHLLVDAKFDHTLFPAPGMREAEGDEGQIPDASRRAFPQEFQLSLVVADTYVNRSSRGGALARSRPCGARATRLPLATACIRT